MERIGWIGQRGRTGGLVGLGGESGLAGWTGRAYRMEKADGAHRVDWAERANWTNWVDWTDWVGREDWTVRFRRTDGESELGGECGLDGEKGFIWWSAENGAIKLTERTDFFSWAARKWRTKCFGECFPNAGRAFSSRCEHGIAAEMLLKTVVVRIVTRW